MAKAASKKFVIEKPDIRTLKVRVVGLSPLMVSQWSDKALRQMAEAQSGAPKNRKHPPRDPQKEYEDSCPKLSDGSYGFSAAAFRLAAVSACRHVDGLAMTSARSMFFVVDDLVKIKGRPTMDTRAVRQADGGTNLRYRARFDSWETTLTIRYNAGSATAEQILNLLVLAGEFVGVGEYRVERGGNYGRFEVK
jgi:hypothetical protein